MQKKKVLYFLYVCFFAVCFCNSCTEQENTSTLPIHVEVWNYYQGKQKIAFDNGVVQFNETKGNEQGIYVTTVSIADPAELADVVINACKKKVGARKPPSMASVYPSEAFILYGLNALVPLDDYFSDDELHAFVPAFIEEGRLWTGGELSIFPALKSSEVFYYNKTDWESFEKSCGVRVEDITSIESLVAAADRYYDWTDSLTPDIPYDGKPLFGRDSLDNYVLFGLYQLGLYINRITIKNIKSDEYRLAFKKLWDNYYVPFIKGRFFAKSTYRSTDMKMGRILCSVGSSAAVNYYSLNVTNEKDESYPIEIGVKKPPLFQTGINTGAIQQGAGFCVLKSTKEVEDASVVFLKWFAEKNILSNIAVQAGYVPPLKKCLTQRTLDTLLTANGISQAHRRQTAKIAADLLRSGDTFAPKPFTHSFKMRRLLHTAMEDFAKRDRAVVEECLEKGMSFEAATRKYVSADYFNRWYQMLCDDIILLLSYA